MKYIPRETAFAKLKALAEGAAIVRRELAGSTSGPKEPIATSQAPNTSAQSGRCRHDGPIEAGEVSGVVGDRPVEPGSAVGRVDRQIVSSKCSQYSTLRPFENSLVKADTIAAICESQRGACRNLTDDADHHLLPPG
jgi:hypothetical protein